VKLTGAAGQGAPHFMFDNSGAIVSGTAPQLILPRAFSRSMLVIANLSATLPMYLEIGSARGVATIANGVVTGVTVTNPGFGFSLPPTVQFRGGGNGMFPGFLGSGDPNSPSPSKPATAHCVMSGTAPNMTVASITVDFGGAGYLVAPYVLIQNAADDANGCADPSNGGGSGLILPANGGSYIVNGTACTTDQMALFCSTGAAAKFTVKWMD
jgi:hypothetical protein